MSLIHVPHWVEGQKGGGPFSEYSLTWLANWCWLPAGVQPRTRAQGLWCDHFPCEPASVAWASSQHGGWVPRVSILRERERERETRGRYIAFMIWPQSHIVSLLLNSVRKAVTKVTKFQKGGHVDSTLDGE